MGFQEKLQKMRDDIVEEADGVTCDSCNSAVFDCGDVGYCKEPENTHVLHGGPITISRWAPRCRRYQESKKHCYKEDEVIDGCDYDSSTVELTSRLAV